MSEATTPKMAGNALECLKAITVKPHWWARPVSWRMTGMALCFEAPHYWKLVPSPRGGVTAYLPSPDDLFGEWEVVRPMTVNTERDSL